jgi:WD40 repeat protein
MALEALPSKEDPKRPVVADAVRALSDALSLYKVPRAAGFTAYRQFEGTGFSHSKICSGTRNKRLFMAELYDEKQIGIGEGGDIRIWDADTGQEVLKEYTRTLTNEDDFLAVRNCDFTSDGLLILLTGSHVIVVDPDKEKVLHDIKIDGLCYAFGATLLENSEYGMLETELPICGDTLWISILKEDPQDKTLTHSVITGIDIAKGRVGKRLYDVGTTELPVGMCVSPDGRYLAWFDAPYMPGRTKENCSIYVADTKTGEVSEVYSRPQVADIAISKNNKLYVASLDKVVNEADMTGVPLTEKDSYGKRFIVTASSEKGIQAACLDTRNGSLLWKEDYTEWFNGMPKIVLGEREGGLKGLFVTGSVIRLYDEKGTGSSERYDLGSSIVKPFFRDEDIAVVLANGDISYLVPDEHDYVMSNSSFRARVVQCTMDYNTFMVLSQDPYAQTNENRVIEYRWGGTDEKWNALEDSEVEERQGAVEGTADVRIHEDAFFESFTTEGLGEGKDGLWVIKRRLEDGSTVWSKCITEKPSISEAAFVPQRIIHDTDSEIFISAGEGGLAVLSVSTEDGSYIMSEIPMESCLDLKGNKTDFVSWRPLMMYSKPTADVSDILMIVAAEFTKKDGGRKWGMMIAAPEDGEWHAFIADVMDLEEGKTVDGNLFVDAGDISIATVFDDNTLYFYSEEGNWKTEELDFAVSSYGKTPDGHILLWDTAQKNTSIHVIDKKSGKEIAEIPLGLEMNAGSHKTDCIELDDGYLLISSGTSAVIVDPLTWTACSVIKGSFMAYDQESKQFLLGDPAGDSYGLVPYRSLDDMIAEGTKLISKKKAPKKQKGQ